MKVLVTGASGFLGKAVVAAFVRRGHAVRAVVRPATDVSRLPWADRVEFYRMDLRSPGDCADAFDGIDALVHLAATVQGDDESRFAGTAVATERLMEAMARSQTRRLVLASSFSCYDWSRVGRVLEEDSPLLEGPVTYERDGYAVAKRWQERIVREKCQQMGWDLRVIRPGFIWGRGAEWIDGIGHRFGRFIFVVGPTARAPLTHVDNAADAFAHVTADDRAAGQTYNLVDSHGVTPWRFAGDYVKRNGGTRIPMPYACGRMIAGAAQAVSRLVFGPDAKLPGLFVPIKFQARFKPIRCTARRLRQQLGWTPPLSYDDAIAATYRSSHESPRPVAAASHTT